MLEIKHIILLFIRSQMAESGPPLGTILGNLGVNAIKFCKDFNDFTKDLPSYFVLKVKIFIMEDRAYNFIIFLPSIGYLLTFVKYQRLKESSFKKGEKENCISLRSLVQLAKLKFPFLPINKSVYIIMGTVKSCNLLIDF